MIQWDLSVETRTTFKHILAERYKKELLRGKTLKTYDIPTG
jgi:hypothetical protein